MTNMEKDLKKKLEKNMEKDLKKNPEKSEEMGPKRNSEESMERTMTQAVFKRYEKKYMVSSEQYNELISRMITRMDADQYGKHTICNIYFDTVDYQMIRNSLDKPVYKEKLRLRSYGRCMEEGTVFLELKKKYAGVVYKRRVPMKLKDARKYLYYGIKPELDSQILREIDYAVNFYEPRPAVYLAYERIAFSGKDDPELRITFDMNVRARSFGLDLSQKTYGVPIMEQGQMLMEIKIPGAMPVWLGSLLSELEIYPVSFSKYGMYFQKYLMPGSIFDDRMENQNTDGRRGVICA